MGPDGYDQVSYDKCCSNVECLFADGSITSPPPTLPPTASPTPAPTSAPSKAPTPPPCTICNDEPTNSMKSKGKTCTGSRYLKKERIKTFVLFLLLKKVYTNSCLKTFFTR